MPKNPIRAALDEHRRAAEHHTASTAPLEEAPKRDGPRRRGLKRELNLIQTEIERVSLDDARAMQNDVARDYVTMNALHMLLIAAPPGVGKTTLGVKLAEDEAAAGKRVLYLGPRHDFFQDILAIAQHPAWWYEWLSRGHRDAEERFDQCYRALQMDKWLARGYDAMAFCSNHKICGWDYVKTGCPYHAQKRTRAPIVFGQHAHLTLGHPMLKEFDLIIGDENPLDAFLRHWYFEARHIVPPDMDRAEPMTEILHELRGLAERNVHAEGPDLLSLLGGAQRVREACELLDIPASAAAYAPNLRSGDDVDEVPYFHLPQLARLLLREAQTAETGQAYPPRVAIAKGKLHLLLRYDVNPEATNKIVWLDATANTRLYAAMFKRPVETVAPQVALRGRVFQVWPRSNGKASLLKNDEPTAKAQQLQRQVDRIVAKYGYTNPAVITFKGLKALFTVRSGHFAAARGTNQFGDCDALIVAGTPQPSLDGLHTTARMLFADRMAAFDRTWSDRDVTYAFDAGNGTGFSYPVSGFWRDEDLQALLWQVREAELIQAAHRARPITRDVDIWLLTNIPLEQLPPTELLTIQDLFDAPDSVDVYRWLDVVGIADAFYDANRALRSVDLVEQLKVSPATARHYLDCLSETQGDRWQRETVLVPNKQGKVGRPAQALVPLNT